MAVNRTRKQKETPHYNFLVSWQPKPSPQARVKGESALAESKNIITHGYTKRANLLTKDEESSGIKKNIIKSLILVSFVLILEVVVYLAMPR
ncbi:MAG TPA: hypothetical protein VKC54_04485 [Patescibacteria group bacterium]|nr:hypothetical protein [Patescibacteria group bacterium]